MGNRTAERCIGRAVRIHMDELMVVRRIRKCIDALLIDDAPGGSPEFPAYLLEQLLLTDPLGHLETPFLANTPGCVLRRGMAQ